MTPQASIAPIAPDTYRISSRAWASRRSSPAISWVPAKPSAPEGLFLPHPRCFDPDREAGAPGAFRPGLHAWQRLGGRRRRHVAKPGRGAGGRVAAGLTAAGRQQKKGSRGSLLACRRLSVAAAVAAAATTARAGAVGAAKAAVLAAATATRCGRHSRRRSGHRHRHRRRQPPPPPP